MEQSKFAEAETLLLAGYRGLVRRKPVLPGDKLVISVEMTKTRGKIGRAKGVCTVRDEIVSEAEVTFMLLDAE